MVKINKHKDSLYNYTIPNVDDWPIAKLSQDRTAFLNEVKQITSKRILQSFKGDNDLHSLLEKVLYQEQKRVKSNPWKADPKDDKQFWKKIKEELLVSKDQGKSGDEAIFEKILTRYVEEIAGNFKPESYKFARRIIPKLFRKLLNARSNPRKFWKDKYGFKEHIQYKGDIEEIRSLSQIGTIIFLPTHFSNIDSILLGLSIDAIGLPAAIYGAGFNLYEIKLFAYFMSRLGAYTVDRRKKNRIYLELLKTYSTEAIRRGCHSLFFPGGTRSRSGAIETSLKLGLLGTAFDAQRLNFMKDGDKAKKVFVVPMVLNYHFVLEAPVLIREYLKQHGKERYLQENDELSTSYKISKFLLKFFTRKSEMVVSFGKPKDLFGNTIDENGNSVNAKGRVVDIKEYFQSNGVLAEDLQRDREYNRLLAEQILEDLHKTNCILTSHVLSFVGFQLIKAKYPDLDLFELLRLEKIETELTLGEVGVGIENVVARLIEMEKNGDIMMSDNLKMPIDEVINNGLLTLGMYNNKMPLMLNKEGKIVSEDLNLLYFYHNRSTGYNLDKYV